MVSSFFGPVIDQHISIPWKEFKYKKLSHWLSWIRLTVNADWMKLLLLFMFFWMLIEWNYIDLENWICSFNLELEKQIGKLRKWDKWTYPNNLANYVIYQFANYKFNVHWMKLYRMRKLNLFPELRELEKQIGRLKKWDKCTHPNKLANYFSYQFANYEIKYNLFKLRTG